MLREIEGEYKMDLLQRTEFACNYFIFLKILLQSKNLL